jgi:Methyltransferase domain
MTAFWKRHGLSFFRKNRNRCSKSDAVPVTGLRPSDMVCPLIYGLDYSLEMLRRARDQISAVSLVRGTADLLPFQSGTFDLIFALTRSTILNESSNALQRRGSCGRAEFWQ